jgi:hypothetical protein
MRYDQCRNGGPDGSDHHPGAWSDPGTGHQRSGSGHGQVPHPARTSGHRGQHHLLPRDVHCHSRPQRRVHDQPADDRQPGHNPAELGVLGQRADRYLEPGTVLRTASFRSRDNRVRRPGSRGVRPVHRLGDVLAHHAQRLRPVCAQDRRHHVRQPGHQREPSGQRLGRGHLRKHESGYRSVAGHEHVNVCAVRWGTCPERRSTSRR